MELGLDLRRILIVKTRRVPSWSGSAGDGSAISRQLDVALMSVGFKASRALLEHVSGLSPAMASDAGEVVLAAARELVGDHVRHNVYFADFPRNVPGTLEFWTRCIAQALLDPAVAGTVLRQLDAGRVNLLELPEYGRYQHTYDEMLAAHEPMVEKAAGRVTVVDLGGPLADESFALYAALASSSKPLAEADLALLGSLAELHVTDTRPVVIELRENRAVVNAARLTQDLPIEVGTTTDVLRLACALSGGDVTLRTPTRLRSFRRVERRVLLAALDGVVARDSSKLLDVGRHPEPFKRLGERLHPHEHPRWPAAQDVFAVARGDLEVQTMAARVERALAAGDADRAVSLLAGSPGSLLRTVDRLGRLGQPPTGLVDAVAAAARSASTTVVLSLREHLLNRAAPVAARLFVNREGRAWATPDGRAPLPTAVRTALERVLDEELASRLRAIEHLVVEPEARTIAVPLSDKSRPAGLGVLPRGSVQAVGHNVRFFVHWKQQAITTDYDLSVLLLGDAFQQIAQVSWTNLGTVGAVHSGDVVEAHDGASEFIDIDLAATPARYVVPQVNVYSGEGFDTAEEAFFGFMDRSDVEAGRPFEPRTVRAKSDLFGAARVSLPLAFVRRSDERWEARWLHLGLGGAPRFNQVENNARSTAMLLRAIIDRRFLRIADIEELARLRGSRVTDHTDGLDPSRPVTYVGHDTPDTLPVGSAILRPTDVARLLNAG